MLSLDVTIAIETLEPVANGSCILCGNPTEIKSRWMDGITGERWADYFDLCESCKFVPSCFICRYSKSWYFRYRGKCDELFTGNVDPVPDCRVFPGKMIGDTIGAFVVHQPCGRYRRGDATKDEFDAYNSDW